MIACYVGGKGVGAGPQTIGFKRVVFRALAASGLGFDTRLRYYAAQYPDDGEEALERRVCAPIEAYDRDWPAYRARVGDSAVVTPDGESDEPGDR